MTLILPVILIECGQNLSEVINFLESIVTNVFKWFQENHLIAKSSKEALLDKPI